MTITTLTAQELLRAAENLKRAKALIDTPSKYDGSGRIDPSKVKRDVLLAMIDCVGKTSNRYVDEMRKLFIEANECEDEGVTEFCRLMSHGQVMACFSHAIAYANARATSALKGGV